MSETLVIPKDRDELVTWIKTTGPVVVAEEVRRFPVGDYLREGIPPSPWRVNDAPGALLFFAIDIVSDTVVADSMVLCVNAPESERAKWEAIADKDPAPGDMLPTPVILGHFEDWKVPPF